ncbi:MAG TPA: DUF1858 domain-containing protein [Patescibacteria group bacterium]|nr:DUF1858 domain-containing protein [Patescibacteria group bacterium]
MVKMIDASKLKKFSSYVLTKDTILSEIVGESPRTAELLSEYGLHCVNCFASTFDTLETGAQVHGINNDELEQMIDEINVQLAKEEYEKKSNN